MNLRMKTCAHRLPPASRNCVTSPYTGLLLVVFSLFSLTWLLIPQVARAQFHVNGCGQNYVAYPGRIPPINIHLSRDVSTAGGTFIGDWQTAQTYGIGSGSNDARDPWSMCVHAQQSIGAGGSDNNIWVIGGKPPTVKPVDPSNSAITTVQVDGETYYVFTTNAMEAARVGFIVRWQVSNHWGETGEWRSPTASDWPTIEHEPSSL